MRKSKLYTPAQEKADTRETYVAAQAEYNRMRRSASEEECRASEQHLRAKIAELEAEIARLWANHAQAKLVLPTFEARAKEAMQAYLVVKNRAAVKRLMTLVSKVKKETTDDVR